MRHLLPRSLGMTALMLALLLAMSACRSGPVDRDGNAPQWPSKGDVVYTRVGMHFDTARGKYRMYSTNHVGMPKHLAPGSALTFGGVRRNLIELHDDHDADYVISFVKRHSRMTIEQWIAKHFSKERIAVPPDLTDSERVAIANGTCERGMSRQALFLAIGYPPKSLTASDREDLLTYEWRRFMRYRVRFDEQDRVVSVGQ